MKEREGQLASYSAISGCYNSFDDGAAKLGHITSETLENMISLDSTAGGRPVTSLENINVKRQRSNKIIPPQRNGVLEKYSRKIFRWWQNYRIELSNGILKYYKEDGSKRDYSGILNFGLYQCFVT